MTTNISKDIMTPDNTHSKEREREAFEVWVKSQYVVDEIQRGKDGYYFHTVHICWEAWQARAAQAQPTQEVDIEAGAIAIDDIVNERGPSLNWSAEELAEAC